MISSLRQSATCGTLDSGDGSILDAYAYAYASATGVIPLPSVLDLYRLRWDIADIADIAVDVSRLRRRHAGSIDDDKSWELLGSLIKRVNGPGTS